MSEFWQALAQADTAHRLSAQAVLLHLLVAFVLGQLVAWVYMWTHHGMSYSRSQVQSIVLLSIVVTTVMLAIGNNLVRAFGLFGALALIRFRTPIKDTRDTAFLFIAVAVGIGVGSFNLAIAIVGTVLLCLVVLYMHWSNFGTKYSHDALLRFSLPATSAHDTTLREVLRRHCRHFALVHMREGAADMPLEFAYQVRFVDPDRSQALLEEMRQIEGVSGVSVLMQDPDSEI